MSIRFLALPVLAALAAGGCVSRAPIELEPAGTSREVSSVNVNDVRLEVDPTAWHAGAEMVDGVIPMRVTLTNLSDRPLVFRYQDLALADDAGREFATLPPFELDRDARVVVIDPGFEHRSFRVLPRHRHHFRSDDLVVYEGDLDLNDQVYVERYGHWARLPTQDMLSQALPEGVIDPGGLVSGYLYFDGDRLRLGEQVRFQANLYAPDRYGRLAPLAEISLPFEFRG